MNLAQLLPPRYNEVIEAGLLVQVIDGVIDKLDLSALLAQYNIVNIFLLRQSFT